MFHQCMSLYFIRNFLTVSKLSKSNPPPNLLKSNNSKLTLFVNNKKLYTQALIISIEHIIHIKNIFLTVSLRKIIEINNIINKSKPVKPKINMTIKVPSRKQVIIPISKSSTAIIRRNPNFHINSINRCFKENNSNTSANFIHIEKCGIIITTNQAASVQDIRVLLNKCSKIPIINFIQLVSLQPVN